MKLCHGIPTVAMTTLLILRSSSALEKCVKGGYVLEFEGDCNFENFVSAYESLFTPQSISSECSNTLEEDIRLQLNLDLTAADDEVDLAIRDICTLAWNGADKIPFRWSNRKTGQFEQIYYNGGTDWNEEVQTDIESSDGTSTNVLKEDASEVKDFYESFAQTSHVKWPSYLSNFDLEKCDLNAAMCCWPQDRQANDGNGNCAKPYDENCYDKDPADNTDLCYVDLSRSLDQSSSFNNKGYLTFPHDNSNGEGAIHCHGFAWSNDEYDFTSRYKANNLFYVSMYDHMHQRGYVRNIPGAPMCACIEQMPTVTRSDCTQIDVEETYKVIYNDMTDSFTASLTDIEIDFNSCQGRYNRNNDLLAYYAQLAKEGKVTSDQRASLSKYLVENEKCGEATHYFMAEKGFVRGYHHDNNLWTKVAGRDLLFMEEFGREGFREKLVESPNQIVMRVCMTCIPSHQYIYYKRKTVVPEDMDLLEVLLSKWSSNDNVLGVDFDLYSSYDDALNEENEWAFCNFRNDRGFPYECGPKDRVKDQHSTFYGRKGRYHVAFYIENGPEDGGIAPYSGPLTNLDIGNPTRKGHVYEKQGIYYLSAAGNDVWDKSDQFHFLQEPISGENISLTVFVSSLTFGGKPAKGGLSIRESLAPNSAHFDCILTGYDDVVALRRSNTGDRSRSEGHEDTDGPSPTWIRLSKMGDDFKCEKSSNGVDWEDVGSVKTIEFGEATFHAGMWLVSRDVGRLAEIVFEDYKRIGGNQ